MRALAIGRFQPLHNGHLAALSRLARECERLTIGIGSADVSHTLENPFTAGERHEMLRASLAAEGVTNVDIVPIPDVNRNAIWVSHVKSLVPPFDVFYTNNALPRRLFEEAGHAVRGLPFVEREKYEATQIRALMLENGDWEKLVPEAARRVIASVRGVERLRDLAAGEGPAPRRAP